VRDAAVTTATYTGVFHGRPDQVSRARRELARYLGGCPAADDATLIVSELATNAVLHSRSRHGLFTVHSELFPTYAWIEVSDAGGTWEPGNTSNDGGRGLGIIAALAAEWGVAGDARGRTVWARLQW